MVLACLGRRVGVVVGLVVTWCSMIELGASLAEAENYCRRIASQQGVRRKDIDAGIKLGKQTKKEI